MDYTNVKLFIYFLILNINERLPSVVLISMISLAIRFNNRLIRATNLPDKSQKNVSSSFS